MSKVPKYKYDCCYETMSKMRRAVEILAEIRKHEMAEDNPDDTYGAEWSSKWDALRAEADKLLTELEVQPSAEGREK